jgi:hypothetical protein
MPSFTATIDAIETRNGMNYIHEFIQTTFAKRGIIITHFHNTIYQQMKHYRVATITFDFHLEYNTTNQESYAERIMYRLHKYADEEAAYLALDKQTRGVFNPSIEPFEMVYNVDTRESWIVKLIHT